MADWRALVHYAAYSPCLLLAVLLALSVLVSPSFMPHFSPIGIVFGLFAGFFEEMGWTGFAFPRMQTKYSALTASIILGVLWGLWHAPVVDYLGAAAPHGAYWLPFFLAFIALVAALRVLICWIYSNTKSVLLAQLLHASNTGFLAILAPSHILPAQETLSYAVYALALWVIVAIVALKYGKRLVQQPAPVNAL